MISVVTYPTKIVNSQPGEVSKWNAVHHAIKFQLQRQDVQVLSAARYSSTLLEIQISSAVSGIVGDSIYFSSGIFSGTATIASIVTNTPTLSRIRVNYSTASLYVQLGGFLNWVTYRENYYIETEIFAVNSTPAYYSIGTSINKPDDSGLATMDTASFLKSILEYKNTFEYNQVNKSDLTQGGQFNIQYRECWTGTTGSWSGISSSNLFYFVNAAKQIQDLYGSNMGEYVPFETAFTTEQKAKFLSDFVKPTFFPGYPFDLSFIYSDAVAGKQLVKYEQQKDINGSTVATSTFDLDPSYLQQVNRLMLQEGYACTTGSLLVWLETDGAACRQYVLEDYTADGYVEEKCGVIEVDTGDTR